MRRRYDMFNPRGLLDLKLTRDNLYNRLEPLHRNLMAETDPAKFKRLDQYIQCIERRVQQMDRELGGVTI